MFCGDLVKTGHSDDVELSCYLVTTRQSGGVELSLVLVKSGVSFCLFEDPH